MSILTRVKEWVDQEVLEASDLNAEFDAIVNNIVAGTTATVGVVQLEDSHASTSTTKAACPKNVKEAYDLAGAAIPKSLLNAHSIIRATTDDNPEAIPVSPSTIIGRQASGNIGALTGTMVMTILSGQAGADFSMGTHKITAVTDPTGDQDAATKKYVDDTALLDATFNANTFIYSVSDNAPVVKTRAEVMALLSGQAGADFALNTHKLTGVVDPTADQDAATKKYVDDRSLWTDDGAYYYPNNWSYMRILDSGRLDIADSAAFASSFPWDDNVAYPGSSAGSMVNIGQESSSDGNPPLWVQKKFNKSSGTATHFAGAGHFEVVKQSGSTLSYISTLTGMTTQQCASGDAIGLHARSRKSAAGNAYAGWFAAIRDAGQATKYNHGIEVNIYNNGLNITSLDDSVPANADMGLWVTNKSCTYPSVAAYALGASDVTKSFWNGILFNTSSIMANGAGINMTNAIPKYGIKFGSVGTAHIYGTGALNFQATSFSMNSALTLTNGYLKTTAHQINVLDHATNDWYWRRSTGGDDRMILNQDGNLHLDGTLTENSWTLDDKAMSRKWELMDTILNAYRFHDGNKLDPVLQTKWNVKNKNGKITGTKYGKRPSDFIQIAIECIADLQGRIKLLEKP